MRALDFIIEKQLQWAARERLELQGSQATRGRKLYVKSVRNNLFERLTREAKAEYGQGSGAELGGAGKGVGKMLALHSSSALACNLLHYWRRTEQLPVVLRALGIAAAGRVAAEFEKKLPIHSSFAIPPNVDAFVVSASAPDVGIAIECKFSEPFAGRPKPLLKRRYLEDTLDPFWADRSELRSLAARCTVSAAFNYLDVPQLLKHLLGVRAWTLSGKRTAHLVYVYYAVPGPEGVAHHTEVEAFRAITDHDGVAFHAVSYQELLLRIARIANHRDRDYLDYMTDRYL